ncbi:MAG: hypothetical protein WD691_06935 [Acidimicrobiales bacterium]
MDFVDLIVAVHGRFADNDIAHAFGGALALGYIAEPRGTVDIDVNVFLPTDDLQRVSVALSSLGYEPPAAIDNAPIAGIRYRAPSEPFPIDVFPSLHDRYAEVERRVVTYPFGRGLDLLPFLSAEDLCVFKLSFGRPQDWVDLDKVASARPDLDVEYVEQQLVALRGPSMYPRLARFRAAFGER